MAPPAWLDVSPVPRLERASSELEKKRVAVPIVHVGMDQN